MLHSTTYRIIRIVVGKVKLSQVERQTTLELAPNSLRPKRKLVGQLLNLNEFLITTCLPAPADLAGGSGGNLPVIRIKLFFLFQS